MPERMKRGEYVDRIAQYLARLSTAIQLNATHNHVPSGIYDQIGCDLLNYIFDYQLTPANQALIMRGVDLIDEQNSISVQVTTTNTRQKIDTILRIFSAGEAGQRLCDRYRSLIILILSNDPLPRYRESEDIGFSLQILNLSSLLTHIERLPDKKLAEIYDYLQKGMGTGSVRMESRASGESPRDTTLAKLLKNWQSPEDNDAIWKDPMHSIPEQDYSMEEVEPSGSGPILPLPPLPSGYTPAPNSFPFPSPSAGEELPQFTAQRQQVLRFACLLPLEGLPRELFRQCLSETQQQALFALVSEQYLIHRDDMLLVSPAMRHDYLEHLRPTRENCGEFLDRLLQYDQTRFWRRLHFLRRRDVLLQLAKTFGQAVECLHDPDGTLALRCAAFYALTNETSNELHWSLRAVQSCDAVSSRDPWSLGNAYLRTADCYQRLGDNANSLKYCKKLLSLCNAELALPFPDLARIHYQTGLAQVGLEDHHAALKNLKKALDYSINSMSKDHPLCSDINNMLSISNTATGNITEAREYKLQSVRADTQSRPVGTLSAELAQKLSQLEKVQGLPALFCGSKDETLYVEIGDLFYAQGEYANALEHHLHALKLREQRAGTAPKKLADSYHSVGMIFSDLDDHAEAMQYLQKATRIRERSSNIPVTDLIRSYLDLGAVHSDCGMYQYALDYFAKALALQEKCLPSHAPELADTYTALGNICRTLKHDKDARDNYNMAVHIREAGLPKNHPDLAAAYMNLANACIQLSKYDEALHNARRALHIYEAIYPKEHPQRIIAQQTVDWLEDLLQKD